MMRKIVPRRNRRAAIEDYPRKRRMAVHSSSRLSYIGYLFPGVRIMLSARQSSAKSIPCIASLLLALLTAPVAGIAAEYEKLAFPEKFMVRLSSYSVQNADTQIAVANSGSGIGVGYSFNKDLGGEDSVTIPRLDAYYRFNDRHRIDFSSFTFKRDGREVLQIEVDLGDQTFSIGETLETDIEFNLFKIGYGYTFFHSDRVELSVGAGLNVTSYDFSYGRTDGTGEDSADASGPLPMFGFRMSYAINPNWSLHYTSESFYVELDDALKGSFTNNEIDIQYRFANSFVLGAGITRFSIDLTADDSDWKGRIADSHRGLLVYASYYL
jgi:hypothetical protein